MFMTSGTRRTPGNSPFTRLFAFGLFWTASILAQQTVDGCQVFPVANIWNTPVASLPVARGAGEPVR